MQKPDYKLIEAVAAIANMDAAHVAWQAVDKGPGSIEFHNASDTFYAAERDARIACIVYVRHVGGNSNGRLVDYVAGYKQGAFDYGAQQVDGEGNSLDDVGEGSAIHAGYEGIAQAALLEAQEGEGHYPEGARAYSDEQGCTHIDWDKDPKRQLSIMVLNDGRVVWAIYLDGVRLNGDNVDSPEFRHAIYRWSHPAPLGVSLGPAKQESGEGAGVVVTVSGRVGSGKSAICKEIEILCRALGLECKWEGGQQERNLSGGDSHDELAMYKPRVTIREELTR